MLGKIGLYLLVGLVIVATLLTVGFATLNNQVVVVDFYFFETQPPLSRLWVVIFGSVGLGLVLGLLYWLKSALGYRSRISKLTRQMALLERELNEFRNQPLDQSSIFEQAEDAEARESKDLTP